MRFSNYMDKAVKIALLVLRLIFRIAKITLMASCSFAFCVILPFVVWLGITVFVRLRGLEVSDDVLYIIGAIIFICFIVLFIFLDVSKSRVMENIKRKLRKEVEIGVEIGGKIGKEIKNIRKT